jgi:hypothetical protein
MQLRHCFGFLEGLLLLTFFSQIVKAEDGSESVKSLTVKLEPSASFLGEFYYERIGYYMENAGDVNGDGFEDFLIGTFHNRENGYDAGAAYLILGNDTNVWGLKRRLREADARFLGKYEYDAFGYYVSGNGDVNGDGYDDFVIGAPAGNELGGPNPGYAFLFFGRPAADWGYECIARDEADASYVGRHDYDHAGEAVAIVGDVNQDGYDDFIVGAPLNDDGTTEGGKVYLFSGRPSGWSRNVDIETADASFITNYYKAWAGYIVSAAGDVNGDGFADFLIGSPHHDHYGGRVYLIFGKSTIDWGTNFDLDSADVIFEGESSGDKSGWGLACAGDVNHDGFSDILIGAYGNDQNGVQAGKVYLILGKAVGWLPITNLRDADASWKGERDDDKAGWSVAGVPDLNYDGCDEIMIGAWHNDQIGSDCGKAYLIYGKTGGWEDNLTLTDIPDFFVGEYTGDYVGYCVAGNDVNGDGVGDFWVSASYNSDNEYRSGKVYLFLSERDRYEISGQVRYYDNDYPVPKVSINITGGLNESILTGQNGNYDLILPYHHNYVFTPSKAKDSDFNAETIIAYDAALTLQASVGLIQLDSLQQKAADADQDLTITAYDAALIARYVVEYEDSGSHVGAWIFDPQQKKYFDLNNEYFQQDFSAVIVGNVYGGWQYPYSDSLPHPLIKNKLPIAIVENNQVKIPIEIESGQRFLSFELQLTYPSDQLSLIKVQKSNLVSDFQFISHQQRGKLNLILYGTQPLNCSGTLLNLLFNINNKLDESNLIKIERFQINNYPAIQGTISLENKHAAQILKDFILYQNFPNPFNHRTAIRLSVNKYSKVTLAIYNLSGEIVKTIVDSPLVPENYTFYWDGTDDLKHPVSSGVYICRVIFTNNDQSFKILFIK